MEQCGVKPDSTMAVLYADPAELVATKRKSQRESQRLGKRQRRREEARFEELEEESEIGEETEISAAADDWNDTEVGEGMPLMRGQLASLSTAADDWNHTEVGEEPEI